jgi:CRP-like cAMP-binding protein
VQRVRGERIASAVRSQQMFRGLSAQDQERITAIASLRDYARGDVVWNEGDPASCLTLILSGRVKVVRRAETSDVILEIFGAGEPIGALAVYNDIPYPATAICMEPTSLLLLPRHDYFQMLERHPELARAVIRELTRLVVSMMRKLQELRGQRIETRIARLFMMLVERSGRDTPDGVEIALHMSRQEVAEMVGTTVESAIRVMSRWGRAGVLITGEHRFLIPSRERLAAIAAGESGDEE